MLIESQPQKFSEYFGLKNNTDLNFVDIYAFQDIQLFLDPYGILAIGNDWSKKCQSEIATYFQLLIDSISSNNNNLTNSLLGALHEVPEVGLGYSLSSTIGRGIGLIQAEELRKAFVSSVSMRSGDIKDIADCALLIPGISRDKISDITANILKRRFVKYTQKQCKIYGVPMRKVAINNAFHFKKMRFVSYYAELPVIENMPKILVPKMAVRRAPLLDKHVFYRHFVLEYLRAEHWHAGDSLATVLKNGEVRVRLRDLKEEYPFSINYLHKFTQDNPHVLSKFKNQLKVSSLKNKGFESDFKPKQLNFEDRKAQLLIIPSGAEDASRYHKLIFNYLIYLFGNRVHRPKTEKTINDGRKRIDIVFDNTNQQGFFKRLNEVYHVKSAKISVECKNYGKEIGNPEIDQLTGRLNNKRGSFWNINL